MHYIKIYHYSNEPDLTYIDPSYYGTSTLRGGERKHGKTGLNKSYYYIEDNPETMLRCSARRYEIYLPYDWKRSIYDRGVDPLNLKERVKAALFAQHDREPYEREWHDAVEQSIMDLGFKGWMNSESALPHAIALFYPLSTKKPEKIATVMDWADQLIETDRDVVSIAQLPALGYFACKPSMAILTYFPSQAPTLE